MKNKDEKEEEEPLNYRIFLAIFFGVTLLLTFMTSSIETMLLLSSLSLLSVFEWENKVYFDEIIRELKDIKKKRR